MVQSIIVYRSPAEAAFYEGGFALPFYIGMGVFLALILVFNGVLEHIRIYKCRRVRKAWSSQSSSYVYCQYGSIVLAGVCALFVAGQFLP